MVIKLFCWRHEIKILMSSKNLMLVGVRTCLSMNEFQFHSATSFTFAYVRMNEELQLFLLLLLSLLFLPQYAAQLCGIHLCIRPWTQAHRTSDIPFCHVQIPQFPFRHSHEVVDVWFRRIQFHCFLEVHLMINSRTSLINMNTEVYIICASHKFLD